MYYPLLGILTPSKEDKSTSLYVQSSKNNRSNRKNTKSDYHQQYPYSKIILIRQQIQVTQMIRK